MGIKKLLKSRLMVAIVCLILAAVLSFGVYNSSRGGSGNSGTLVQVTENIPRGTIIEESQVTEVNVIKQKAFEGYIATKDELVGKFAVSDLAAGSMVLPQQVADDITSVYDVLANLPEDKVAVTIAIANAEGMLAEKIVANDIVSIFAKTEKDGTDVRIRPAELTYVKVICTTTTSGIDKANAEDVPEDRVTFATLMVTPAQAVDLFAYSEYHLALVSRDDEKRAAELLNQQESMLKGEDTTIETIISKNAVMPKADDGKKDASDATE